MHYFILLFYITRKSIQFVRTTVENIVILLFMFSLSILYGFCIRGMYLNLMLIMMASGCLNFAYIAMQQIV